MITQTLTLMLAAAIACPAILLIVLAFAKEGWEDARGFHHGRKR